jgi:hypothetical protein
MYRLVELSGSRLVDESLRDLGPERTGRTWGFFETREQAEAARHRMERGSPLGLPIMVEERTEHGN